MKEAAATALAMGLGGCTALAGGEASIPAAPVNIALPAPLLATSPHNFETTLARLDAAVGARPLKVFAVIDHAGGAATVGESLAPSRVLIVGNPKGGTPFMQANPAFAHELPLRISVFEDDGTIRIAIPDIEALSAAYGISPGDAPVTQIAELLSALVSETLAGG